MQFGEALGNPDAHGIHQGDGAVIRLVLGRLDEAKEGFTLANASGQFPTWILGPFHAWLLAEAGEVTRAAEVLAEIGCPSLADLRTTTCGWASCRQWPAPARR